MAKRTEAGRRPVERWDGAGCSVKGAWPAHLLLWPAGSLRHGRGAGFGALSRNSIKTSIPMTTASSDLSFPHQLRGETEAAPVSVLEAQSDPTTGQASSELCGLAGWDP